MTLSQIEQDIKTHSDNIISLNSEDAAVLDAIPDADSLLHYVDEHRKDGRCYVFLDERPG